MRVKELKELLNQIDENVDIILCDNNNKDFEIDEYNVGEVTFQGACDEEGNLLPDGMDEKYDVKAFMIQFKEDSTTPDFRNDENGELHGCSSR